MGSVRFGIPRDLVLTLKAKHNLRQFVETGTLVGHTSIWASEHFPVVTTVDVEQQADFTGRHNIVAITADSAEFLEGTTYDVPTLFWLDAHTNEVCPVLREIAAINGYPSSHVILVDDVRLFGSLPNWPSKQEVIDYLLNDGKRTVYEIEDVLVAEPCP